MLEVKNLKKRFGDFEAVKGVSFTVSEGEVLGFLGPNGAGKSTTMRMITGFLPPTSGAAVIDGHDITLEPIAAKEALGYLPESAPSYKSMTVGDYLSFVAEIRGRTDVKKAVADAINKAKLGSRANQTIETLSKGYRQRTAFAAAILKDPKVLIMDEPTDGLDPNQKFEVRKLIHGMAENEKKAVIISTHILEEVDAVCTHVVIIADGEAKTGTADNAKISVAELKKLDPSGDLDVIFRKLTMGEAK
ncbi:MAG: ABC transporter ATP-binding protein [Kiritimatiellae bacterium]|nr:ABC transporter ATP-binding protein [Kiritimatiellia bacterium]